MLMVACERSHPQVEAVLQQTDALMEAHPDSAFSLLDSLHYRQPMSKKETARYALLLAKATDKTYQSLIPCDSLLNVALRYYEKPTADRATALLYKACLEDEVNHDEEAIKHLQEARLILKDYPEEKNIMGILLSLLGDLYYQHKHYADCLPVYQESLQLSETDRDKAVSLHDIGSYYTMTNQKDSALFYHQEALKYALICSDSLLIANEYHYLALCQNVFSQVDSALYYENLALTNMPENAPRGWLYYEVGSLMQQAGYSSDSITFYINKAVEDSAFTGRFLASRLLSNVEQQNENYKDAIIHLQNYVEYADSLNTEERSVDVQQLIYDYDTRLKVKDEQAKNEREQERIIRIILLASFLLMISALYLYFKYRQGRLKENHEKEMMLSKLSALQESILKDQETIEELKTEATDTLSEMKRMNLIIEEKEKSIEKYRRQALEISNHYFSQTESYNKIISRAKVRKNKQSLQVFTQKEQSTLKDELFGIYSTYVSQLMKDYPLLKDEDLMLLCLEAAGIGNQAIALCLGSVDYHIVYSRKARMRERMIEKA